MSKVYERVIFRLIVTPCCGQALRWVNPRFPNYCPECGKHIYPAVKGQVVKSDSVVLPIELERENG